MLKIRVEPAENGRAEQDPGEQLTHHRGLADTVHGLAEQSANQNQGEERCEEGDLGRGRCVGGSVGAR